MISIIEFIVYGSIAYFTLAVLITTIARDQPMGKGGSLLRVMWIVPGMLAASMLSTAAPAITWLTKGVEITTVLNSTGGLITNSTTVQLVADEIVLINPVWTSFHYLIFVSFLVYLIVQVLILLVRKD